MFVAKFRGICSAECGDPILPGELCRYVGTALVHEACAQEVPEPRGDTKYKGTTLEDMGY